jgi:hypothetical protein
MGISPWNKGDGKPNWTFSLEPDSGIFDTSGLSPSDFTLVMINISNQQAVNGTGTFSDLIPATGSIPATITYQLSSADTANLGMYNMRVVSKKGTASQQTFEFGIWECIP